MDQFSHLENHPKTGKRGRPKKPKVVIDPELKYATLHKTRDNGKVVKVERNIIFGNQVLVNQSFQASTISNTINTSFIERLNLNLRNHSRKLTRKTLCFAKRKTALETQTNIVVTYYNFSKPNRSLTLRDTNGKRIKKTPAMAVNLTDRIWPIGGILAFPFIYQLLEDTTYYQLS